MTEEEKKKWDDYDKKCLRLKEKVLSELTNAQNSLINAIDAAADRDNEEVMASNGKSGVFYSHMQDIRIIRELLSALEIRIQFL